MISNSRLEAADRRLAAGIVRARARRPWLARAYGGAIRHRWALLAALGAAWGYVIARPPASFDDSDLFLRAGRVMLSEAWAHALDVPAVQAGPLHLGAAGVLGAAACTVGLEPEGVVAAAVVALAAVALPRLVRALRADAGRTSDEGRRREGGLELFVGLVVVLGGVGWVAAFSGQGSELFVPALWVAAARDACRGRGVRAGLLIGAAAGLKLWGVLGIPVLLFAPRPRDAVGGLAAALGVTAAAFAPFFIAGSPGTLSFAWVVRPNSALALFVGAGEAFTWPWRMAQGAAAIALGAALAALGRRSDRVVWTVPLAIVAARMVLDPLAYYYYWVPAGTLLLLAACRSLPDGPSWARAPVAIGFYATLLPFFLLDGTTKAYWMLAATIALVAGSTYALRGARAAKSGALAG